MKLLMCHCRMCKLGRDSRWMHTKIRSKAKGARRLTKMLLQMGEYEKLQDVVLIGYTD
jgi:hypothetical protein